MASEGEELPTIILNGDSTDYNIQMTESSTWKKEEHYNEPQLDRASPDFTVETIAAPSTSKYEWCAFIYVY